MLLKILLVALAVLWAAPAAMAQQPNVVVIMADDQTLADMEVMPRTLEALADEGVTYSNFVTQHGVCAPSRATYLTGQYPDNHGVLRNQDPYGYLSLDHTKTLPVWMQDAGYWTAYVGKHINGYGIDTPREEVPPGFDHWQVCIKCFRMYEWTSNLNGVYQNRNATAPKGYQTDAWSGDVIDLILSREGNPQPFFITFAPTTPHKESSGTAAQAKTIRPAPRHDGLFADNVLPEPPSYNEQDVTDKPNPISKLGTISPAEKAVILRRYQDRREALQSLDESVEHIVQALDNIGELDNTVIIYWSDNGYFFGEHRIEDNKNEVYEESIKAPLIIRGPGFAPGTVIDAPVANIDIAPTITGLGAAVASIVMDGIDLRDPVLPVRDILINAYHGASRAEGVRTPEGWLYVEHTDKPKWTELYDLSTDPYQLQNLCDDGVCPPEADDLVDRLDALR